MVHSAAPCQYTLEQCATPPSTFTVRQETQTALASRQNMWKNEDPALARSARFDVRSLGISIFRRWIISHFNKLHGVSNFYASCKIQPLLEFCYLEIKIIWESQEMSSGNWARDVLRQEMFNRWNQKLRLMTFCGSKVCQMFCWAPALCNSNR